MDGCVSEESGRGRYENGYGASGRGENGRGLSGRHENTPHHGYGPRGHDLHGCDLHAHVHRENDRARGVHGQRLSCPQC